MIDKIVSLIIEQARHADGQNTAAKIHSVLMDVRQAVARTIADEQKKERKQRKSPAATCD